MARRRRAERFYACGAPVALCAARQARTLEVMFHSVVAAIVHLAILGLAASTESVPAYGIGVPISTALLLELTGPERTGYRIGIVNSAAATGILLRGPDSPAAVEYVDGFDSFLWAQAAEQLPAVRLEDRLRFRVGRRRFNADACPELPPLIANFQLELDAVIARPVSVKSAPPAKYRKLDPEGHEEITVDGAGFWIQVSLVDATLIVIPDGGSEPPLQTATSMLHSELSRCADTLESTLEEHDF